jgi:hypothetical protein
MPSLDSPKPSLLLRVKHEDDSEEEANMKTTVSAADVLRTKYPDAYEKLQKEELGFLNESWRKSYLFVYNLFMFCGFLYAFTVMSLKYAADQDNFPAQCWDTVGNVFKFLHLFMFLEVLNPLFGYTRGSVVEAALQVGQPFNTDHWLPGHREEHLDLCPDRQRAEDAGQAGRVLPLHDLLLHRALQIPLLHTQRLQH